MSGSGPYAINVRTSFELAVMDEPYHCTASYTLLDPFVAVMPDLDVTMIAGSGLVRDVWSQEYITVYMHFIH
jgi:hypothetical protein